jgi:hypothetical protein
MKKLIFFVIFLSITSVLKGEVSVRVCLADGNTPLELADPNIPFVYRDIMVGTWLTIIVSSDTNDDWDGELAVIGEDREYGMLSARDYNEATFDWAGSRLPAAGDMARVWDLVSWPDFRGFYLAVETRADVVPGDWFIIDYNATDIGTCNVAFYDHAVSWEYPIYFLTFSHVPTRDFNCDTKVDFADLAVFASYWQLIGCNDPNGCEGTDLDTNGNIDLNDLILFTEYWLESTQ